MKKLKRYTTSTFREIMHFANLNPSAFKNKKIDNNYNSLVFNSRGELVRIKYFDDLGITEDTKFSYSYWLEFDYSTVMNVLVVKRKIDDDYETYYAKCIDDLLKQDKDEEIQTIHTPNELGKLVMIYNEIDGIVGEE